MPRSDGNAIQTIISLLRGFPAARTKRFEKDNSKIQDRTKDRWVSRAKMPKKNQCYIFWKRPTKTAYRDS